MTGHPPRPEVTLFLCGDVMTGRGIDQVLPHPCRPALHEDWVKDAREYVMLAESESGPIHVLDWGYAGLEDTLVTLDRLGIAHAGAGRNTREAGVPAEMQLRPPPGWP